MAFLSFPNERSLQSYRVFLDKAEQHKSNIASLRHHLPLALSRLNQPTTKSQAFRVLSIGSGMGEMDLEILQIITEFYGQSNSGKIDIFNRAIEPNEYMLGKYKEGIEYLSNPLKTEANINFDLQQVSFQKYAHEHDQVHGCKFHMVHFIHSIYFVDVESALLYCYNEVLGEKGVIVCIVQNRENLIYKMHNKIKELQEFGELQELQELQGATYERISSDYVTEVAIQQKWVFEEHRFDFEADITEIFKSNSTEGDLLLDFLTQGMNVRDVVEKKKAEKIEEVLKDISWQEEDGKRKAKMVNDLIIILKGC